MKINKVNIDLGYIRQQTASADKNPLQHFYIKSVPSFNPFRNFQNTSKIVPRQITPNEHSIVFYTPSLYRNAKSVFASSENKANPQHPLFNDKNIITIIEYVAEQPSDYLDSYRSNRQDFIRSKDVKKGDLPKLSKAESNVTVIAGTKEKTKRKTTIASPNTLNTAKPKTQRDNDPNLRLFFKTKAPVAKESDSTTTVEPFKKTDVSDSIEEPEETDKGPFSGILNKEKETAIEALKQGGVIIKRLRVRNGGIAIAGPGGVATAGSGGTAIVGPGGIALTHPRSLTIAGPGARVISVPESTDLETLALQSTGRDFSGQGVLVATGPIIYYNSN